MDDLKRHYGQGGYLLFLTGFFASMVVTQTERGDDMFMQMVGCPPPDHMADHAPGLSGAGEGNGIPPNASE